MGGGDAGIVDAGIPCPHPFVSGDGSHRVVVSHPYADAGITPDDRYEVLQLSASGTLSTTIGGADAGQWMKTNDTCVGTSLAGGGTCHVDLKYVGTGAHSATLTVTGTTAGDSATATLTGT